MARVENYKKINSIVYTAICHAKSPDDDTLEELQRVVGTWGSIDQKPSDLELLASLAFVDIDGKLYELCAHDVELDEDLSTLPLWALNWEKSIG